MQPELTVAAVSVGVVAILCAVIAYGCRRAVLRTGNRRIQYVTFAFLLLAAKNLLKAIDLASGAQENTLMELAFSLADLAAVALIAWPLLSRRP